MTFAKSYIGQNNIFFGIAAVLSAPTGQWWFLIQAKRNREKYKRKTKLPSSLSYCTMQVVYFDSLPGMHQQTTGVILFSLPGMHQQVVFIWSIGLYCVSYKELFYGIRLYCFERILVRIVSNVSHFLLTVFNVYEGFTTNRIYYCRTTM